MPGPSPGHLPDPGIEPLALMSPALAGESFTISAICKAPVLCHSSVQSLSHVQLFATPWTAACQASLSFTISQSLLKLMSIEMVMPSNYLIFCRPLLLLPQSFPALGSIQMSQFFTSGSQSIGVSDSVSVLSRNIQFSHSIVSDSLRPYRLQHTRLPCPSPTPGVCSNPCPLSW